MSFSHKYNYEEIHLRAIVRGLVNLLNNKVVFKQTLDDETEDKVQVPFYFQMTGSERFLQNNFLEWGDCADPKFAEGNYEIVPRGVVKLMDDSINSANFTNRFIRATYTKEIDGKLESFSANINPIPMIQNFEVEIVATTLTDLQKCKQVIIENFAFVQIFNVKFKGFMIANQAKFPENYSLDKQFEYSYPDEDNDYKLTFSLEVETYYPVIDTPGVVKENFKLFLDPEKVDKFISKDISSELTSIESRNDPTDPNNNLGNQRSGYEEADELYGDTERHLNEKMESVLISNFEEVNSEAKVTTITLIYPTYDLVVESGKYLPIRWETVGFIHKVDILYSLDNGTSWLEVEKFVKNDDEYKWLVPDIENVYEDIIFISDIGKNAKAKALIDATGAVYSTIIEDSGYGYDNTVVASVVSKTGSGSELQTVVVNGQIVDIVVKNGGSDYTPNKTNNVNILIKNSANQTIFDIMKDENGNIGHIIVK